MISALPFLDVLMEIVPKQMSVIVMMDGMELFVIYVSFMILSEYLWHVKGIKI